MSRLNRTATISIGKTSAARRTDWKQLPTVTDPDALRSLIASQVQAWGGGFLLMGAVQLIPGTNLDHVWGVILILAAGMSFYFNNAALLPAYGVLLAWAALSNLLSGEWLWIGFAVLQTYWVFQTFQQFAILRRAAARLGIGLEAESLHHADKLLPGAGFAFTTLGWLGFGLWWAVLFWYAFNEQALSDEAVGTAFMAVIDLAVLGLAFAVAALAARYRFRPLSILAIVGAGLLLVCFAALMLLGSNV